MKSFNVAALGLLVSVAKATLQIVPGATWTAVRFSPIAEGRI